MCSAQSETMWIGINLGAENIRVAFVVYPAESKEAIVETICNVPSVFCIKGGVRRFGRQALRNSPSKIVFGMLLFGYQSYLKYGFKSRITGLSSSSDL